MTASEKWVELWFNNTFKTKWPMGIKPIFQRLMFALMTVILCAITLFLWIMFLLLVLCLVFTTAGAAIGLLKGLFGKK